MYCAVQVLSFLFGDEHRGREFAERRARIRAMPLDVLDGGVVQHGTFYAGHGDTPALRVEPVALRDGRIDIDDVATLRPVEGELQFAFGAPRKASFSVPHGAWARVIMNHKRASGDHKWLVEVVVNAGTFDAPPRRNVFFGEPTILRDMRHDYLRNGYVESTRSSYAPGRR